VPIFFEAVNYKPGCFSMQNVLRRGAKRAEKKRDKDAAREERFYTSPQKKEGDKMQHGKSVCIPTPSFSVSSDLLLLNTTQLHGR